MLGKTHQISSIAGIVGAGYLLNKYGIQKEVATLLLSLPIIAIPYICIFALLPDCDGKNKLNRIWILRPGFFLVQLFTKHRGFTHRIEGIASVGALLCFLSLLQPNILTLAILTVLSAGVVHAVIENRNISNILTGILIIFSPVLLIKTYYIGLLLACFIAYILHMVGDSFTKEGWTIVKFGDFELTLRMPIGITTGGVIEKYILTPIFIAIAGFCIFQNLNFYEAKVTKEAKDTVFIYKDILVHSDKYIIPAKASLLEARNIVTETKKEIKTK